MLKTIFKAVDKTKSTKIYKTAEEMRAAIIKFLDDHEKAKE